MTTARFALTVLGVLSTLTIHAQVSSVSTAVPPVPEPRAFSFEQFIADAKKPADWFSWGADFRARNEYFHEIISLTESDSLHEQDVVRFRGRLWASASVVTNLTLNGRVSAEPRVWMRPSFVGVYRAQRGTEWRYGIADLLNAKWEQAFDLPLTISAGRQDLFLGDPLDWWLVADGTPGDGSWTFFLDSVRLTYGLKDANTTVDLIYIDQEPRPEERIPTLGNSNDYLLNEQQERGAILYVSNKSIENTQLDGYFLYKHDEREQFSIQGNRSTPGDNADIYTFGGKITGTPGEHWQYSAEGAYQFGQKEDRILGADDTRDINAFGGKAKLSYLFKDPWKNQLFLTGEFLSGDDPETEDDEMFDLLWGRWPRWSELYIYSYIVETSGKVGQMNNLGRVGGGWSVTPMKGLILTAAYNALLAPEETPTRALTAAPFSGDGHFRGHYAQAVLRYQISKHLSTHLWTEGIWQGDFYKNHDFLSFVRAEILLTF